MPNAQFERRDDKSAQSPIPAIESIHCSSPTYHVSGYRRHTLAILSEINGRVRSDILHAHQFSTLP